MDGTTRSGKVVDYRPPALTFDDLAAMEPRLAELEADILGARKQIHSPRDRLREWYWNYKGQLRSIVGWASGYPRNHMLGGSRAWDVAYQHLVKLLMRRTPAGRRRGPASCQGD
jgi:hypothetical protein